MNKFLYQLDDQEYRLPWAKADLYRLRLWYIDLLRATGGLRRFSIYTFGGSWSDRIESWDVDLFLTVDQDQINADDIENLRFAHRAMSIGYGLGLDQHRLLIDFTLTVQWGLFKVFEGYRDFESGRKDVVSDIWLDRPMSYGIFRRYRKVRDGIEEFNFSKASENKIDLGNSRFLYAKRSAPKLTKQMNFINAGRVYHQPVRLDRLLE